MVHPVVEKPIIEHNICRDGSIDYSSSNMVNPLVSFSMVKEFYDMQAKSLDCVLEEIYDSISRIQNDIQKFQSYVDTTNNSFTLLQRNVTGQLEQMKKRIESANDHVIAQLDAFSERLEYLDGTIEDVRGLVRDTNESNTRKVEIIQKRMDSMVEEMCGIRAESKDIYERIKRLSEQEKDQNEKLDMITQIMFPKLSEDFDTRICTVQAMIESEIKRSVDQDSEIAQKFNDLSLSVGNQVNSVNQKINDEILRAQGEEQKLVEMVGADRASIAILQQDINAVREQLGDDSSEAGSQIGLLDQKIAAERDRATNAEDAIRTSVIAETTRATSAEDGIRSEVRQIFDNLGNNIGTDIRKLNEKIDIEVAARKEADDELTDSIETKTNDLYQEIKKTDQDIRSDLEELITRLTTEETTSRIASDKALYVRIDTMENRVGNLRSEVDESIEKLSTHIEKLVQDADLLADRVAELDAEYDSAIQYLKERVAFLSSISQGLDDMIEATVKRTTTTLVTRIEKLDNRLDAEVRHNRATEDHLQDQIDAINGISHFEDDELSFDDCDE